MVHRLSKDCLLTWTRRDVEKQVIQENIQALTQFFGTYCKCSMCALLVPQHILQQKSSSKCMFNSTFLTIYITSAVMRSCMRVTRQAFKLGECIYLVRYHPFLQITYLSIYSFLKPDESFRLTLIILENCFVIALKYELIYKNLRVKMF